jgi:flagellar protein FliS
MNAFVSMRSSYVDTAKKGRVLSANSHQLITILLEELLNLLDEICVIHTQGKTSGITDQKVMALTILDSLLLSLDYKKGGDLADNLALIYTQVRALIESSDPAQQLKNNRAAHQIISEIFSAWSEIG